MGVAHKNTHTKKLCNTVPNNRAVAGKIADVDIRGGRGRRDETQ